MANKSQLSERQKDPNSIRIALSIYETQMLRRKVMRETIAKDLASRVFALSRTGYVGCGFHYALEQKLGRLIECLAVYHKPSMNHIDKFFHEEMCSMMMDWLLFEEICEMVVEAEESATNKTPVAEWNTVYIPVDKNGRQWFGLLTDSKHPTFEVDGYVWKKYAIREIS